jgi:hypothetical protein
MMDQLSLIIQGGAVGLSALIIWAVYRSMEKATKYQYSSMEKIITLVSNHMNHNTEALTKLCGMVDNNTSALCELKSAIKGRK